MIKMEFLKFSLLVCITGSSFAGVIEAKNIEAQKPSIAIRAVKWVRANPAKTIAIAVVIGGGIYGTHEIYKYNQAKEQIKKEIIAADAFKDFEKNAKFLGLSDKDIQKLIQEEVSYATYADNFLKQYGLPSFASIYSMKQGSSEEANLGIKMEEILTSRFKEELESENIDDPNAFITKKYAEAYKKASSRINEGNSEFKQKYFLAIKDKKFVNSASRVEAVIQLVKSNPKANN